MQVDAAHRCVLQTNVLSPQRTSLVSGLPRLEVEDDPSSPLNSDPSSSSALSSSLLSSQTLTRTSYPPSRVVQDYLLNLSIASDASTGLAFRVHLEPLRRKRHDFIEAGTDEVIELSTLNFVKDSLEKRERSVHVLAEASSYFPS